MVIEDILPQLPKKTEKITAAYTSCSDAGKFIQVQRDEFFLRIEKAKSDLKNVASDFTKEAWDWSIIKSYYAIHHALNALLIKEQGFYSKDHLCTILALKHYNILPENLYVKFRTISSMFADFTGFDVTYTLRKISQYDVQKWKLLTKKDAELMYLLAQEVVAYAEERCSR